MKSLLPDPRAFLALLLVGLTACMSGAPSKRLQQSMVQTGFGARYVGDAEYENYLKIGDRVSWSDEYNTDVRGNAQVDIDGTIIVPEVGAVVVAGLTRTQIESLLSQKYAPYYQRNAIQVDISTSGNKFFFLLGEVTGPGRQPFTGDLTLFDVVMTAGIKDQSANLGRVQLVTPDPRTPLVQTFNISEMIRTGDSTGNVHIKEWDIVVVPPTMLAQVGYFLQDLLFPITNLVSQTLGSILALNRVGGTGGFGQNKNKGFAVF